MAHHLWCCKWSKMTGKISINQSELTVKQLQDQVHSWITTIGVRYFDPLTNFAILTEEIGEVARIMSRRYGEQSYKESDNSHELADELADVLFVLVAIANQTECDLTEAIAKNFEKKTNRDSERHKANEKLKIE